jgi:hypothetical protein
MEILFDTPAPGGNHLYLRFAYEEGELKIGQLPT